VGNPRHLHRPTRDEIAQLPLFAGLALERIHLVETPEQVQHATRVLHRERYVGFDTETKPVFSKGVAHEGPHVVQLATPEQAFVVQVKAGHATAFLKRIVESRDVVKVGFGLKSDRAALESRLGMHLAPWIDLADVLRARGFRDAVGAKAAVAIVLGQRLQKSRSVTTSNWARQPLTPRQLLYAANDAFAALMVFRALDLAEPPADAPRAP
jgi:ribonuclease D